MDKEIWKDISGYEGLYQVSNYGKVKSNIKWRGNNQRILKFGINQKGYLIVVLRKNKKSKTYRVHRLVAQAFIPNIENKPQVNHIDGNKQNNFVNNLEWCNNSENQTHAILNNLRKHKHIYQYDLQGNFIKEWLNSGEIKRKLNFSKSSIWRVCNGLRNKYKNYIWKYADSTEDQVEKI